ncbi:MAG: Dabb family protein [Opitutae bacterium]|nr:Dabb family protein [Opitutae bacterium]
MSSIFLSGCFSFKSGLRFEEETESTKRIHHFVLCWLKEPGNLEHRKQIIEASKTFRRIPGVLEARAGVAVPSDRTIVDDSFDVGILIVVRDKDSLSSYLEHPLHQRAKEDTLLPLVAKILVYDLKN